MRFSWVWLVSEPKGYAVDRRGASAPPPVGMPHSRRGAERRSVLLLQDERVPLRNLAQAAVPTARTAMSGPHVHLEQERLGARGSRPQLGHPLGGLQNATRESLTPLVTSRRG